MTRKSSTLLMTALAAAMSSVFAQEAPPPVSGYVAVGGISTDVTSANKFRLYEFRDLDSGVTAGMNVRFDSGAWWHRLFGENLGRDDQSIELKGGRYGIFKYTVYNEDIIHNLTYNAITPFTGIGTNNLTFAGTAPPSTDTATWSAFDYRVKHSNVGALAEAQPGFESPFYLRVTANRKESEGIKPLGSAGTSPGGPTNELAAPIDWTTTDWSAEAGYSSRALHVAGNVLISKFESANDFLFWRTPAVRTGPNIEQSTLAPDSDLKRVGVNAIFRQLPLDSSLALRGVYTKVTNSFPIATTFLAVSGTLPNGVGVNRLVNPSEPNFDGEVINKSFSAAWNASYSRGLSSKVYYNWYKRENNSSEIVFTPSGPGSGGNCDVNPITAVAATTCSTEFLHFRKSNVGAELYYRLPRSNRLTLGVDYQDTERERIDFERSKETKATVEWKSGMFEVADFRVKYQHLQRKSDFELASSVDIFNRYLYRFDAAPLKRDQVKVVADTSPVEFLDLGVEVIVKRNRYTETLLGRNRDKREEVSLSAGYGDPKRFRVSFFGDVEHTSYDSTHWVGAVTTFPNTNTAGTAFLWNSKVHDRNWLAGAAFDWPVLERLTIKGSAIIQRGDGGVDFVAPTVANAQNIVAYDDFKKRTFNVRGVYAFSKQVQLTLGYAYEKYTYTDIQMDGYLYNIATGVNQNYFSGAYAFPNYKASIVYGTVVYRF